MTGQEITIILESIMAESAVRWTDRERKLKLRNWIEKLSGLTSAQGKIGLDKALDHPDSFMPGVGQFREMCLSGEGCSSIEDQAHTAWALVIQHLNAYSSPIFKDSAIAESIRSMGGWRSLCSMETAVEAFRKKDFIGSYVIHKRRGKEYPPKLYGQYNDPVFIGYHKSDDTTKVLADINRIEDQEGEMIAGFANALGVGDGK